MRIIVNLLIFLLATSLPKVYADEQSKTLTIGMPDDFPPFYFRNSDGTFSGISYNIVVSIAHKLGYEVQAVQFPNMKVLLGELDKGRVDVVPNLTATNERMRVALFTQTPHVFESQDILVRKDSHLKFDGDLESLADYRIGVVYGWTYGPEFDSADFLSRSYTMNSIHQLKTLLSGDVDLAVNNAHFFMRQAEQLGVSNAFRVLDRSIYDLPVSMAVSRSYPFAEALVQAL